MEQIKMIAINKKFSTYSCTFFKQNGAYSYLWFSLVVVLPCPIFNCKSYPAC